MRGWKLDSWFDLKHKFTDYLLHTEWLSIQEVRDKVVIEKPMLDASLSDNAENLPDRQKVG